ncbi:MAG TPA: TetR/AcrR family transcriptional regulator [Rhizomicrobium sp.]|nr:TetR/AcrR family transcriptional regulator [Rhizomicrobium sp.]
MASATRKISASQRAPRRGARVLHILGESLECFAESGFERVTYDELIARSKVSRGSFYWYFPSKEALYEAVLDTCVTGYVARLEDQFAKTDPKDHIVKRLLDTSLADFNANRSQYRLLLRPPPSADVVKKLAQWNDDVLAFMRGKLEPAVKAGKLDRETADTLPDVLSAFIDGICVRLVLEDENSVSTLSRNIERFLCRIVDA